MLAIGSTPVPATPLSPPASAEASDPNSAEASETADTAVNQAEAGGGTPDEENAPPEDSAGAAVAGRPALTLNVFGDAPFIRPGATIETSVELDQVPDDDPQGRSLVIELRRVADGEIVETRRPSFEPSSSKGSKASKGSTGSALGSADGSDAGVAGPIRVDFSAPQTPGVYEIRCRVMIAAGRSWTGWRRDPESVATAIATVVVAAGDSAADQASSDDAATNESSWEQVGMVRASDARVWSLGPWLPSRPGRLIVGDAIRTHEPKPSLSQLKQVDHAGEVVAVIPPGQTLESELPSRVPGTPHRVTVRFPSGSPIRVRVEVIDRVDGEPTGQTFIFRRRLDRRPNEAWHTHRFVTYPSERGQRLRITNLDAKAAARLESIRVEAGPSRLADHVPKAVGSEKRQGRTSVLHIADADWIETFTSDLSRGDRFAGFAPASIAAHRADVAAGRLIDYLREMGMNGAVIPIHDGEHRWYAKEGSGDAGALRLETVLGRFDRAGLNVWARWTPDFPLAAIEKRSRDDAAASPVPLRRTSPFKGGSRAPGYNPFHPAVADALIEEFEKATVTCRRHPSVRGVVVATSPDSHFSVSPDASLDDPALAVQFVESRGDLSVPRGQRRAWAAHEGRDEFAAWLAEETEQLLARFASVQPATELILIDESRAAVSPDASAGAAPANVLTATTRLHPPSVALSEVLTRIGTSPRRGGETPASTRHQVLHLGTVPAFSGGTEETIDADLIADFTHEVDRIDPAHVIWEIPLSGGELSSRVADASRGFVALPVGTGQRRTPNDPGNGTVGVRQYRAADGTRLAIANRAPWGVEVELRFDNSTRCEPVPRGEGPTGVRIDPASGAKRVKVFVPALSWTAVHAKTPPERWNGWSARPSGGETTLRAIHDDVTAVFERLGKLTTPEKYFALSNGGFERTGDVELSGWLHAQHPPDAVTVDRAEVFEGKRSIRMNNSANLSSRAWLVSETIPPPSSGRLSVSLACRAAAETGKSTHPLRVAIEGVDGRGPFKHSAEIAIPRNGQWQTRQVVLEVNGLGSGRVENLRLTLDSLASGRIWVDDVHLHDRFPTAAERSELRSQAFLAVQGLQRANLTAASRLLQNFWARELLSDVDATQPSELTSTPGSDRESSGGMAARFREWLPGPLRF